jgi:coenzyme PQQ precursor peptide PqqA
MVRGDPTAAIHENHEVPFMISRLGREGPWVQYASWSTRSSRSRQVALCNLCRRHYMKWETPTATDLRFGFEITMYVSAR